MVLQVNASAHGENVRMCEKCALLLTDRDLQRMGTGGMSLTGRIIAMAATVGGFLILLFFLFLLFGFVVPL